MLRWVHPPKNNNFVILRWVGGRVVSWQPLCPPEPSIHSYENDINPRGDIRHCSGSFRHGHSPWWIQSAEAKDPTAVLTQQLCLEAVDGDKAFTPNSASCS